MYWHFPVRSVKHRLPSLCTFYGIYWSKQWDNWMHLIIYNSWLSDIWKQYWLAVSCASRMVDYCWHNVEVEVQQCYIAVKLWFRGSLSVILKYNELHLKLTFFKSWHLISGPQIPWKYPFYHHLFLENSCGPLSIYRGQFLLSPSDSLIS